MKLGLDKSPKAWYTKYNKTKKEVNKMFYSYANNNGTYTKAVSLKDVRTIQLRNGDGKSAIRFSVRVDYLDATHECFHSLTREEAEKVYQEILKELNKGA